MKRVSARASGRRASVYLHLHTHRLPRALTLLLAAALLNLTAAPAANANDVNGAAPHAYAGEVTVVGEVHVDGSAAASGQTVFPGSAVKTQEKSRSVVNLGPLGRFELSPRTSLSSLDFGGAGTACALEAGRVRVYAPAETSASVKTSDAAVSSAGGATAVFSVESSAGATSVFVQSGQAEVRAADGLHRLSAGESYTTEPKAAPKRELSDDQRKGLYVALAAAVAVVLIVLAARGGGDDEDEQFGGCIDVISGESHCF